VSSENLVAMPSHSGINCNKQKVVKNGTREPENTEIALETLTQAHIG